MPKPRLSKEHTDMLRKILIFLLLNAIALITVGLVFSWQASLQVLGVLLVAYTVGMVIFLIIDALTTPRGPCIG